MDQDQEVNGKMKFAELALKRRSAGSSRKTQLKKARSRESQRREINVRVFDGDSRCRRLLSRACDLPMSGCECLKKKGGKSVSDSVFWVFVVGEPTSFWAQRRRRW